MDYVLLNISMKYFDCRLLMIPLCIGLYFGLAYVVEFFELFGCLLTMIFGGEDCEDGVEFETPQVNLNQANFYLVLIFNIIGIIVNVILIAIAPVIGVNVGCLDIGGGAA